MKGASFFRSFGLISLLLAIFVALSGCSSRDITVQPEEDQTSVIRNPAMGWVLYADAFADFPQAAEYWESQDPYAGSASIFYVRLPWSQLEPQEGVYAWENDQNFKDLIQGALDRGLKLAFRVYVDSEGSYRQATPEYVRDAGAEGIVNTKTGRWDPYVDDPVFQKEFSLHTRSKLTVFFRIYDIDKCLSCRMTELRLSIMRFCQSLVEVCFNIIYIFYSDRNTYKFRAYSGSLFSNLIHLLMGC